MGKSYKGLGINCTEPSLCDRNTLHLCKSYDNQVFIEEYMGDSLMKRAVRSTGVWSASIRNLMCNVYSEVHI